MFSGELTNLEYAQRVLDLRNELLARGEADPFLPNGHNVVIDNFSIEKANNVADVFQQCIDYAQGDNEAFTNELMRRTNNAFGRR